MLKSRARVQLASAAGHSPGATLDPEIASNPSLFIAQFRLLPGAQTDAVNWKFARQECALLRSANYTCTDCLKISYNPLVYL